MAFSRASKSAKYPAELAEHYAIKDTIGSGGFAKVKVAKHRISGEKVAVKVMDKAQLLKTDDLKRVAVELNALKRLKDHQHISTLYQVFETEEKFYLVLEFAPGGELFDYIVARDRLKEHEARRFFQQICAAVDFCHKQGIIHRDLKPENLLLDDNQDIRLIDFGLVSMPEDVTKTMLKTCCGSAAYAAPELIRGEPYLGEPADIWSLGILLYALLCGFLPFDHENTQKLYRLIQKGQYEIPPWLSPESTKFIGQLLKHHPEHRLTMKQILSHPWMVKDHPRHKIEVDIPSPKLSNSIVRELAKFWNVSEAKMKHCVMQEQFDHVTAAYELLCKRKAKGHSVRLSAGGGAKSFPLTAESITNLECDFEESPSHLSPLSGTYTPVGSMETLNLVGEGGDSRLTVPDISPAGGRPRAGTFTGIESEHGLSGDQKWSSMYGLDKAGKKEESGMTRTNSAGLLSPQPKKEKPTIATSEKHGLRGSFRSLFSLFGSSRNLNEPRKVKGLFNVSTTSSKEAREVYKEVLRVLNLNGYEVKEKGFLVKAKKNDDTGKNTLTMTFEVCRLAQMDLTGIRLTRVKGDTWAYKKACQVLLDQMRL